MKTSWKHGKFQTSKVVYTSYDCWMDDHYMIILEVGNQPSRTNPHMLGVVASRQVDGPFVYVVEKNGKWIADASTLQEAKDLCEADRELTDLEP